MKSLFPIALLVILLFTSCGECGRNIKLGEFNLNKETIDYLVYDSSDTLIFEDKNGLEHILTSAKGLQFKTYDLYTQTLCDEGSFDKQHEYYTKEHQEIFFQGNLNILKFHLYVSTHTEDFDDNDTISIFDQFNLSSTINRKTSGQISIITKERVDQVSERYRISTTQNTLFIGDTILYGKPFKDVIIGKTGEGQRIFYNKKKGVLAFKKDSIDYWIVKE